MNEESEEIYLSEYELETEEIFEYLENLNEHEIKELNERIKRETVIIKGRLITND